MLQIEQYWKTQLNTMSTNCDLFPAVIAGQTEDSITSDFDWHHLTLMSQEQDGGWEAEIHWYLKDLPANVTKDTDIVKWWQVCFIAARITLFTHWF
jgi:hypothetical protein